MKIKIKENEIYFAELPILLWIISLVFLFFGIGFFAALFREQAKGWKFVLGFAFFGILFSTIGIVLLLKTYYRRIWVNRWLKTVKIKEIGIRGRRETIYKASETKGFYYKPIADDEIENNFYYAIFLGLKNGNPLCLNYPSAGNPDQEECELFVNTANNFLKH